MNDLDREFDRPTPLDELRHRLRRLHRERGEPSCRQLSRRAGVGVISHTTVNTVLRCTKLPRLGQLELVVMALAGDGPVVEEFQRLWVAARDFEDPPGGATPRVKSDDPAAALDRDLHQARNRQNRTIPASKAAHELDPDTSKLITELTGQLEYGARLIAGAWDGKLDQRGGDHWKMAGYIAEKAGNAETTARQIVQSIHAAKGWPIPGEPEEVLDHRGYGEGDQPAIRKAQRQGNNYLAYPCYFCGRPNLRLSWGDDDQDPTRIELYCDNPNCEAREVVVLVRRGMGTHLRADVRALRALDNSGTRRDAPPPRSALEP